MPSSTTEWKAWPGGSGDTSLNPTESFDSEDFGLSGNVNWDVGQGQIDGVIIETGTTTATNRSSITVRYDNVSTSHSQSTTVWIQATSGGQTVTKKRTIFNGSWSLKFSGNKDWQNSLLFPADSGSIYDPCQFNWDGDNNASRIAGRMEAKYEFTPEFIDWSARGVNFHYGVDADPSANSFKLEREVIVQSMYQPNASNLRGVSLNDEDWRIDLDPQTSEEGGSHPGDTEYPTTGDVAYRIDAPGFDPDLVKQGAMRVDLREITQWFDGQQWWTTSRSATWFFNATAVLPDGAEGGTNTHGAGTAEAIPNTRPIANAGADDCKVKNTQVQLNGSGSDADNDGLIEAKWTQTGGTAVSLSDDTVLNPTFTAPGAPTTLTFQLKVTDQTKNLHHHRPDNYESLGDSVNVQIVNAQSDCP